MAIASNQWQPQFYLDGSAEGAKVRAMVGMDLDQNNCPRLRIASDAANPGRLFSMVMESQLPADNDKYRVSYCSLNDNGVAFDSIMMDVIAMDVTAGSEDSCVIFTSLLNGAEVENLRMDGSGVVVNHEQASYDFRVRTPGLADTFRVDASQDAVAIGLATPDAVSLLELSSTTKGFRLMNMTTTQRDAISSPPAGLCVYNSTTNKLNVYSGSAWEAVTSA